VTIVQEYEITKVNISQLQFDETNPNKLTKDQETALKRAFKRFGYLVPIVINENYEIGDGEHRAKLYQELGIQEIPAYVVPKINDDIERRLLRQTMNKLRGEHEIKLDADEIALIFQNNKLNDLSELLGNQRDELEQILTKHKGIQFQQEDNFDVDKELEDIVPVTELGDIWQLGNHRIICADCSDKCSIDKLIQTENIDIIITDPPYGMNLDTDWSDAKTVNQFLQDKKVNGGHKYDKVIGDNTDFNPSLILDNFNCPEIFLFGADYYCQQLPKNGSWLVWDKRVEESLDSGYGSLFELIWSKAKHKREIIRVKWFGIFGTEKQDIKNRVHPTQKPLALLHWLLDRHSDENNIIFDPFLGSGSTLIACEQTNRICYGVEIDPRYIDIICKRYLGFTGQEPVREKDNKTYSELKAGN